MRNLTLVVLVLVALVSMAAGQEDRGKGALVKPVKTWEGRLDPDLPAEGEYSIDLMTDAKGFALAWRLLRWGQEVPKIDFDREFAVLMIYPGGQYFLEGLKTDGAGDAKVVGHGIQAAVAVPKGRWYVLAVFPRATVKSVGGQKVPPSK